jgi:hypothetical protein
VAGFEPTTPCSQNRYATKLRYTLKFYYRYNEEITLKCIQNNKVFTHVGGVFTHLGGVFTHLGGVFTHLGGVFTHVRGVLTNLKSVLTNVKSVLTNLRGVLLFQGALVYWPNPERKG